jgi:hypothetical protein
LSSGARYQSAQYHIPDDSAVNKMLLAKQTFFGRSRNVNMAAAFGTEKLHSVDLFVLQLSLSKKKKGQNLVGHL